VVLALVLFHFIFLAFVSLTEKMRQSQAAQLTPAQRSTTEQHAERLAFLALVVFHFVVFNLVSLAKQVRQQKAAHSAFTQHPTAEQQTECSALLALTFRFVQNAFSFHGLTPFHS
jgi:hypothetical protein